MLRRTVVLLALTPLFQTDRGIADERAPSASRGRRALLESHKLFLPKFRPGAHGDAWRTWGLKEKPSDYDRLFRERYGLHPADHGNDGLPMGLRYVEREGRRLLTFDCLMCHSSSFNGRSLIGAPNSSLDYTALVRDLAAVDTDAFAPERELPLNVTRGTMEVSMFVVAAFSFRNRQLDVPDPEKPQSNFYGEGTRPPTVPEDPPAWWNLRYKTKGMYITGMASPESKRSLMIFLMDPRTRLRQLERLEPTFADVREYLREIEPPEFPFEVDEDLASTGRTTFEEHCSRCHGTYGKGGEYPNLLVELDEIGTDPDRATKAYPTAFVEFYNETWYGEEASRWRTSREQVGYVAPPLHGVWATAPYLHNGSVPTVWHLLDSKSRPRRFARTFRTDSNEYDPMRLGWRTVDVGPAAEKDYGRQVYDTGRPGHSNKGHDFGDVLSEDERRSVIEYLKTL